jgi:hypothetical protein
MDPFHYSRGHVDKKQPMLDLEHRPGTSVIAAAEEVGAAANLAAPAPAADVAKPPYPDDQMAYTSIEQRALPRCLEPSYVRRRTEI